MARKRGGKRTGTPGVAYQNRTDLNRPSLPVQAASNQPYGQRGAQEAAQRSIPLPRNTGLGPEVMQSARNFRFQRGSDFRRPSESPGEPLTSGISTGPGPGPESLPQTMQPNADLLALAPYLPTLELIASSDQATVATRNYVRRLRGAMP